MTTEQIVEWVIAIIPSVIAVCTCVGAIIKLLKQIAVMKSQIVDLTALEEIKAQLKAITVENYELKRTLNETLTKIDRIRRD